METPMNSLNWKRWGMEKYLIDMSIIGVKRFFRSKITLNFLIRRGFAFRGVCFPSLFSCFHELPDMLWYLSRLSNACNDNGEPIKSQLIICLANTLKYWSMEAWVCPTIRKNTSTVSKIFSSTSSDMYANIYRFCAKQPIINGEQSKLQ